MLAVVFPAAAGFRVAVEVQLWLTRASLSIAIPRVTVVTQFMLRQFNPKRRRVLLVAGWPS